MEATLAPLKNQLEELSTLDGVHLLVALHRLVVDTSPAATEYAARLSELLFDAAMGVSERYQYGREQHDTWRLLIETRLRRWIPAVRVTEDELSATLARLDLYFDPTERNVAGRPKLGPLQVGRGRAERRWRRYAYVVAALKRLDAHEFPWKFAACTDGTRWIERNSERISQHIRQPLSKGDNSSELRGRKELPPISMPAAVHELRRSLSAPDRFPSSVWSSLDEYIVVE